MLESNPSGLAESKQTPLRFAESVSCGGPYLILVGPGRNNAEKL